MKILSLPLGMSTGIVGIYLLFPIGFRVCLPRIQDYSSGGLQILGKLSTTVFLCLIELLLICGWGIDFGFPINWDCLLALSTIYLNRHSMQCALTVGLASVAIEIVDV